MAADVFMEKTAFTLWVSVEKAPMAAVEKVSENPFIDGPTKSKAAARPADQARVMALSPPLLPATRISVVARPSGKGSLPCRSWVK
ncbi:MAG: hypothetical protein QM767_23140 [Anaeromyxobacter sp.]